MIDDEDSTLLAPAEDLSVLLLNALTALRKGDAGVRLPAHWTGLAGKVADVTFLGNGLDCHVTLDDGSRIRVQLDPTQSLEVGQRVGVRLDRQAASVFTA